MKPDDHLKKAERLEATITRLRDAPDYETIIEDCYSAAVQYIAILSERRKKRHIDTHKGLAHFLDENDLTDLATAFRQLESLRTSRFYGGQGDGKAAREAKHILAEIKAKLH